MVGRSGGRVAGKAEIITNSAQLGLGLGLSLAKVEKLSLLISHLMPSVSSLSSLISIIVIGLNPYIDIATDIITNKEVFNLF